jgi:endoglucanase
LYITTGDTHYLENMQTTPYLTNFAGLGRFRAMRWDNTATLGALSLVLHAVEIPEVKPLLEQIVLTADAYLATIAAEGYGVSITTYEWGSNSDILNNAIVLGYASDSTGDKRYLYGMTRSMDYLLGHNPLAFSYISGYGQNAMAHPHHRAWANDAGAGSPPPGVVAGGPNAAPSDPTALERLNFDAGPSRRYVDLTGSWSTNEVAINWNAPLVWVSTYLNQAMREEDSLFTRGF